MTKCFVHLGRNGDIINTLPILKLEAERTGKPANLLVSVPYVGLLDGCSYVTPVPFKGDIRDLVRALSWARSEFDDVVNLQVTGTGYRQERTQSSFILEQWANADLAGSWGLPLVFDRRDKKRERALVKKHDNGRPMVLVAAEGISSPFPHRLRLLERLRQCKGVNVVDLSTVKGHRLYDLLGLYDAAACLITTDTSHLHLAHGSKVPVIALVTDGPTDWHRSPKRPGHVLYFRYSQYLNAEDLITLSVERMAAKAFKRSRFIHAIPMHKMDAAAKQRHDRARETWTSSFGADWYPVDVWAKDLRRTAKNIGDTRDLQYVRDLIDKAHASAEEGDVILVSNSDVCVTEELADEARLAVHGFGAFFTHRWDFDRMPKVVTRQTLSEAKWYPGSDLFGFSKAWWAEHGSKYPDMLIGAE